MTDRFRKIIAGSEIAGGAVVMVLTLWPVLQRVLPAWYLISTEGLGAMAIAAGLWHPVGVDLASDRRRDGVGRRGRP